jgi:hypothetical protein
MFVGKFGEITDFTDFSAVNIFLFRLWPTPTDAHPYLKLSLDQSSLFEVHLGVCFYARSSHPLLFRFTLKKITKKILKITRVLLVQT